MPSNSFETPHTWGSAAKFAVEDSDDGLWELSTDDQIEREIEAARQDWYLAWYSYIKDFG